MASLVWLITGCTSGSGLALVHAIAARGDKVIATGRDATSRLAGLAVEKKDSIAVLDLDVTAPLAEIQSVIAHAVTIFGGLDVLVNNAGVMRMAGIEEASEAFIQHMFDINVFGAIKTTQAVLPHMRAAKRGTVVFIGAGLGWAPLPFFTYYSLTKAALTMFAEGLQKEVAPLGLRSVIFEPGGFESRLAAPRDGEPSGGKPNVEDYLPLFGKIFGGGRPQMQGDITKLPDTIIDVVKGEGLAKGRPLPMRVILGPDALDVIRQKCSEQLEMIDAWEDVTLSTMLEGRRETPRGLLKSCSVMSNN
ncbi:hypothetical protein B0H63DRAFT_542363 [Podospora didyma]|uniref:Oxidoreductase n=1 Tax=Podospora didyma TaxID=330526 RepID=A0AAE0NUF3_9PEZI|nr:hypothetical protein B0H63DRAFT_542363 [Podospora didyma]